MRQHCSPLCVAALTIAVVPALSQTAVPARINVIANGAIIDISGLPISVGVFSVVATDASNNPVKVNVAGAQNAVAASADRPISNGSLATALQVPNPAVSTPSPLRYRITIRDTSRVPNTITVYPAVDIEADSNGQWDFGAYLTGAPSIPSVPTNPSQPSVGYTIFADTTTAGAYWKLTTTSGRLTLTASSSGAGAVTSSTFVDETTGASRTLTVSSGRLSLN